MTQLVVTADAEADLDNIVTYLGREAGARIADDYERRLSGTIERLVNLPETGAPRPRLGQNVRIAVVSPYVLICEYTRDKDTLTLLRILHGKRNIARELLRR
jgi:plasmid stabilization system protein ParE